jgi:hypothetical protein
MARLYVSQNVSLPGAAAKFCHQNLGLSSKILFMRYVYMEPRLDLQRCQHQCVGKTARSRLLLPLVACLTVVLICRWRAIRSVPGANFSACRHVPAGRRSDSGLTWQLNPAEAVGATHARQGSRSAGFTRPPENSGE